MINKVQKNRLMTLAFLLILHSSLFTLHSSAQMRFGYLSYSEVLQAMPDYATVKSNVAKLQGQFEDEMKRAEEEFNKKYEEFLEGQHEFAVSIRNKRQSELQDLMEKNMAFKQEARCNEAASRKTKGCFGQGRPAAGIGFHPQYRRGCSAIR